MTEVTAIKIFEKKKVRTQWDEDEEKWYFSIIDVIGVLTDSPDPKNYWKVLKHRLIKEGNQSVTNCNRLKLKSSDGKFHKTDVADTEQLFRLIQSIPSPKAEPFKQWMTQIANERLNQFQDPELYIEQAMPDYKHLGYSDNWINQRLSINKIIIFVIFAIINTNCGNNNLKQKEMLEQNKNNLEYKRFIFNELGVNAFVLYDDTREAVIVDGAAENEKQSNELLKFIEEKNLKVKYIISTHGHFDHIYGNSKLLEKFKVPLLMHKDDNIWIENFQQITARYGMKTDKAPLPTKTIDEGDTIKFGNSELLVFHVPGHSAGSIVLYAKEINLLISGDTLFEDSIGRTDLEGGDYNTLIKNIKEKILVLPPNTIVFPGHGNSTTVEYESKNNPYLK